MREEMILSFEQFVENILCEKQIKIKRVLSSERHYAHTKEHAKETHKSLSEQGFKHSYTTGRNKKDGCVNHILHYVHKDGRQSTMEVAGHFHPTAE